MQVSFPEWLVQNNQQDLSRKIAQKGMKNLLKEARSAYKNLRKVKDLLEQIDAWRNALLLQEQVCISHLKFICEFLRVSLRFPSYSLYQSKPFAAELRKRTKTFKLTVAADGTGLWTQVVKDGKKLTKRWEALTPPDTVLGWIAQRTL